MRCAAALSTHPIPAYATGDVIAEILDLNQPPADLVVAFATPAFGGTAGDIAKTIQALLRPRRLALMVSDGIIGAGTEVTAGSGIALWSLWLDDMLENESAQVFSVDDAALAENSAFTSALHGATEIILFGIPEEPRVTNWIDQICDLRRGRTVSGALLAASQGGLLLNCADDSSPSLLALAVTGIDSTVALAHGTTALSAPMVVSSAVGSMLCELDDRNALQRAKDILASIETGRRSIAAQDLAVALLEPDTDRVVDVYRVLGADRTSNSLALSHPVHTGDRVAFHRQDRFGPLADLEDALRGARSHGALVFSCGSLNPNSDLVGTGEVGLLGEALGTSAYAGIHVASVIGPSAGGSGLCSAPFSAVIFGRSHH